MPNYYIMIINDSTLILLVRSVKLTSRYISTLLDTLCLLQRKCTPIGRVLEPTYRAYLTHPCTACAPQHTARRRIDIENSPVTGTENCSLVELRDYLKVGFIYIYMMHRYREFSSNRHRKLQPCRTS